jgi:hypothetical protein
VATATPKAEPAPTEEAPAELTIEHRTPLPPVKHENLNRALAAFQSEVPNVRKGRTAEVKTKSGSNYSYDYADLSDITEAALPLLGRHGLSFTARPTTNKTGAFVLRYELRHESGERIRGDYPLPPPQSMGPQDLGSAITYARRYALTSVTGIAPGGDDDDAMSAQQKASAAAAAAAPTRPRASSKPPARRPAGSPGSEPTRPPQHTMSSLQARISQLMPGKTADEITASVLEFTGVASVNELTVERVLPYVDHLAKQAAAQAFSADEPEPGPPADEDVPAALDLNIDPADPNGAPQ